MTQLYAARAASSVRRITERLAAAAALLALCLSPAGARAGGIEKIGAYDGTWRVHIDHYKTAYSRARSESNTVRNECWRSSDFYACHQFVDGKSAALIVYTYDPKTGLYHTHAIVPGAAPSPAGLLTIQGATWTYPWQDKDERGRTVYVRIINTFRGRDTIAFRQEYSFDRMHWTRTADGIEHRTA